MDSAIDWLAGNAGLVSALLGFLSAVTLGIPAWREIRDRRHWDTLAKTVQDQTDKARASGAPTNILAQLDDVQWEFVKKRMGSYLSHRRTIVIGLILLALSFAFDAWDNIQESAAAGHSLSVAANIQ